MKNEITITIQNNDKEKIHCDILHIEDETDYDMTFNSIEEMTSWAKKNGYTINHIEYA